MFALYVSETGFQVREEARKEPRPREVLVRVHATTVNPIDAKRAHGYGRRILSLKGAGSLPRVLGNDIAGVVEEVGRDVRDFSVGDRVFGLVPTGDRGAHASEVVVDTRWIRRAPQGASFVSLATLPYSFTTMWLAVHGAGLSRETAKGRQVAVLGARGGLGVLAASLLTEWGAVVRPIDRGDDGWRGMAQQCDAALNFAAWNVDRQLSACLAPTALGQATTVHPLLQCFDDAGWAGGAYHACHAWLRARAEARRHAPGARYVWTVFGPSGAALDALAAAPKGLPVGISCGLADAREAFAHVDAGRPGRAVLCLDGS